MEARGGKDRVEELDIFGITAGFATGQRRRGQRGLRRFRQRREGAGGRVQALWIWRPGEEPKSCGVGYPGEFEPNSTGWSVLEARNVVSRGTGLQ